VTQTVGFYREAWLVVAQGGWWKPREILEQLPVGVECEQPHSYLWIMANRHHYLARRGNRQTAEYAVTPDCVTPQGLTVAQLGRALIGAETTKE
jgi:hypothetical protein